jgi:hypothetical protein
MIFVILFCSPTEQPHRATIFVRKYPCLLKYQWRSQPLHSMIRGTEESSGLPLLAPKIDSTHCTPGCPAYHLTEKYSLVDSVSILVCESSAVDWADSSDASHTHLLAVLPPPRVVGLVSRRYQCLGNRVSGSVWISSKTCCSICRCCSSVVPS